YSGTGRRSAIAGGQPLCGGEGVGRPGGEPDTPAPFGTTRRPPQTRILSGVAAPADCDSFGSGGAIGGEGAPERSLEGPRRADASELLPTTNGAAAAA